MKIFLDTADLDPIKKYQSWGVIDGVTTNPSWLAREWVDIESRIREITEIVDGPISAEVCSTSAQQMIEDARRFSKWHHNIVVKLPITPEGLEALSVVSQEGIKTNMTLCFSVSQAILVAKAGATYVSPFVGRLTESGGDGVGLVADIVTAFAINGYETEVLAASFRSQEQIEQCILAGTDVVTIKPEYLEEMMQHDMTDKGMVQFAEACEFIAKVTQEK